MKLERRQIIILLAAAPALGFAGAATVASQWWAQPPGEGLKVLSTDEFEFAQALAEAWMPHGGDPPLSGAEAQLGTWFDEVLATLEPEPRTQIKLLLQMLDDWTVPLRFSQFRHLSLEGRTAQLQDWIDSELWPVRAAISGILVLLSSGWTTHPEVVSVFQPMFGCHYGR